jgi:uncharacterized protein
MLALKEQVDDFLAQQSIAVTGVSRSEQGAANLIYRKLRETGYQIYPVNPNLQTFDGEPCYPTVKDIPQRVDAVVIVNKPAITDQIAHECVEIGIKRIWMHRAFHSMGTSFSP